MSSNALLNPQSGEKRKIGIRQKLYDICNSSFNQFKSSETSEHRDNEKTGQEKPREKTQPEVENANHWERTEKPVMH